MLNLAIITCVSSLNRCRGGNEESIRLLIGELIKRNVTIALYSYPNNLVNMEGLNNIKKNNQVNLKPLELFAPPLTLLPRLLFELKKAEKNIDMFHIYNVFPMAAAGLYKVLGGKKTVVATLNNYAGVCPTGGYLCNGREICSWYKRTKCLARGRGFFSKILAPFYSLVYPALICLMKKIDGYIAISNSVKTIYSQHGYNSEIIQIIPNFMEDNIKPINCGIKLLEKHEYQSEKNFKILFVGGLSEHKGVDVLIRAFALFIKERPNSELIIVGNGPQKTMLMELSSNLGITKNVIFPGGVKHKDIWSFYQASDIFVHPGVWPEPFGRTILEAMTYGLPCIVSDLGAPPDIVENAGLVFPAGNVKSLFKCLIELHDNEDTRNEMASNIKLILNKYKSEKVLKNILQFYEKHVC
ncbi:glycosyltransferase [Desulfocucumis palustris]|uniref:Glycosyltransferase n=1 Tax=Desulfocucumis palustris TaxID=1898651 RepID=A0A2L2XCS4_9FIRM|nr:glycosyltransferase family 4 protein [Desulfocucumis palustris]GBF33922.1 glycosyltransferase [Desulfocucumis palustris]